MEEVGGFLQGERDYINLAGGTGPLVYERILRCIKFIIFFIRYPAGFVYLYSILYLYENVCGGKCGKGKGK